MEVDQSAGLPLSAEHKLALRSAESLQGFAFAQEWTVSSPDEYEAASAELATIKERIRALEGMRKDTTRPMDDAKRRAMDLFRVPIERLQAAQKAVSGKLLAYRAEQDRLQAERELRARDAQRREQARLHDLATEEDSLGHGERAAMLRLQADMTIQPMVMSTAIAGAGVRETWRAEVIDVVALCRAVADGIAPPGVVVPNTAELNRIARKMKGSLAIPGVRPLSERTTVIRTRGT